MMVLEASRSLGQTHFQKYVGCHWTPSFGAWCMHEQILRAYVGEDALGALAGGKSERSVGLHVRHRVR